ncbi:hypothetical protein BDA96_03G435700 [Sorghum bicolor]|uniref:Uncharacterized protein n=2 Tax=Sorghum bicolor TaxID=4558 RepID=A0A921UQD5_SORBI|nr:hypothetical protein BDA96_03G435700 [Sorghum bicolor]OQU88113.1 hypothetical protein SORBI_3003G404050 [Sorghum bicolor]
MNRQPKSSMVLRGTIKLNSNKLGHQEHGTGHSATKIDQPRQQTRVFSLHLRCRQYYTMNHPHDYRQLGTSTVDWYSQYTSYPSSKKKVHQLPCAVYLGPV